VEVETMKRILLIPFLWALTSCASLPSNEKVATLYEREHDGRKVIKVEERAIMQHQSREILFEIFYITPATIAPKSDTWRYYQVAEGWIREQP
jgi:hypothetical protein